MLHSLENSTRNLPLNILVWNTSQTFIRCRNVCKIYWFSDFLHLGGQSRSKLTAWLSACWSEDMTLSNDWKRAFFALDLRDSCHPSRPCWGTGIATSQGGDLYLYNKWYCELLESHKSDAGKPMLTMSNGSSLPELLLLLLTRYLHGAELIHGAASSLLLPLHELPHPGIVPSMPLH